MKKVLFLLMLPIYISSQLTVKGYSKFYGKKFVMDLLGVDTSITQLDVSSLAADNLGELSTLIYKCEQKKASGLVLVFRGGKYNEYGTTFTDWKFRNFTVSEARELFLKLDNIIETESHKTSDKEKLLYGQDDSNIYFRYKDVTFLIYWKDGLMMRLFWKDFDASWKLSAYKRTRNRFEKKLNK